MAPENIETSKSKRSDKWWLWLFYTNKQYFILHDYFLRSKQEQIQFILNDWVHQIMLMYGIITFLWVAVCYDMWPVYSAVNSRQKRLKVGVWMLRDTDATGLSVIRPLLLVSATQKQTHRFNYSTMYCCCI